MDTLTTQPDPPLHPQLYKLGAIHRRRLRWLSLAAFLTMAGFVMFEMVIAFRSPSAGSILWMGLIGMIMLPVVVSVGGLLWYLSHVLSRSLSAASQLLRDCTPQTVRLTPIESAGRGGVLATLHPADAQDSLQNEPHAPHHALINSSYQWGPVPTGEQRVQLYTQQVQHGRGLVALPPDGALPLLGKWVDRSRYERQRRILRWVAILMLLLIIAAIGLQLWAKPGT